MAPKNENPIEKMKILKSFKKWGIICTLWPNLYTFEF